MNIEGIEHEWWYQQHWCYKNTKLKGPFLDIEIDSDFYVEYEVVYMPFIYKGNRIILSNEY